MSAGCVVDTDVAVSIFIIFQRLFCRPKSLQVESKVLVLVNITAGNCVLEGDPHLHHEKGHFWGRRREKIPH